MPWLALSAAARVSPMRVPVFCVCRASVKERGLPGETAGFLAPRPRLVGNASCDEKGQEGNYQCETAPVLEQ